MPSTTKTLTGPSKASKYPYRYQQDVKDRNDFRMKVSTIIITVIIDSITFNDCNLFYFILDESRAESNGP